MVADIKEGLDALRASRGLLLAFAQVSIAVLVLFMLFALAPAYVSRVIGIAPQDSYVILGPATLGAILSAVVLGQFLRNIERTRVLIGSLLANGVTLLALAAVPQAMAQVPDLHVHARITGAVFSLLLGIEFGAIMIPAITYLMESTSDEIRGRIFALLYMVINGVTAIPVLAAAALSDLIGTAHVEALRSLRSGGAPSSQHGDDDDHGHDDEASDADVADHRGDQREVAAEEVAGHADGARPGQAAEGAQQLKAPERHVRHSGQHRSPGPQPEDEARGQHRLVAMAREEQLRAGDVLRADSEQMPEPLDERPAASVPEVVADVGARHGTEKAEQDDEHDAVVSRRRPCGRGKQQGLAGKGHACAFDEDAKSRRRVAERVDDRGRIHWQSPLPEGRGVRRELASPGPALLGGSSPL